MTEGALKADVASYFMRNKDICFIAVAGVGNTKGISNLIKELSAKSVNEAFDMDKLSNEGVKRAVSKFNACMKEVGIKVYNMKWNTDYKGIDDMLLAKNVYEEIAV